MEKMFALTTYAMLTIAIPGIPLMIILALNNNPGRWLPDRLQEHRKKILTVYIMSTITLLLIATNWLSAHEIWVFIKYATVPTLVFAGAALYPYCSRR